MAIRKISRPLKTYVLYKFIIYDNIYTQNYLSPCSILCVQGFFVNMKTGEMINLGFN